MEARVGIEPTRAIDNTQVVDSTWGQKGEKGGNGESLYKSVQKVDGHALQVSITSLPSSSASAPSVSR
jgi:hypothetical protein